MVKTGYRGRVAGGVIVKHTCRDLSTVVVALRPYLDRGWTVWIERLPPPGDGRRDVVEVRPDRTVAPCDGTEPSRWHSMLAEALNALG